MHQLGCRCERQMTNLDTWFKANDASCPLEIVLAMNVSTDLSEEKVKTGSAMLTVCRCVSAKTDVHAMWYVVYSELTSRWEYVSSSLIEHPLKPALCVIV